MSVFEDKAETKDYHVFTTDNEYMAGLGLGSFTTGTLYNFWYQKDHKGDYFNRKFTPKYSEDVSPKNFFHCVDVNLGRFNCVDWMEDGDDTPNEEGESPGARPIADGTFEAWRFSDLNANRGTYQSLKVSDWQFFDAHKAARDPIANEAYAATLSVDEIKDDWLIEAFGKGNLFTPTSEAANGYELTSMVKPKRLLGKNSEDGGLGYISALINANNYVVWKQTTTPALSGWTRPEIALLELVDDIKTSKSGCLNIPVSVEFNLAPGQLVVDKDGNEVDCTRTEDFTINLYLFDEAINRNSEPTAVMANTKHVGVPVSSAGIPYKDKEDGESSTPDENVIGDKVAADIDLFYNEYTGKWSSGGRQILAKVVKEIGPATIPSVDDLIQSVVKETLKDPDSDLATYTMGTGLAMPINMQNGNQYQWTPNYLSPKECRADDDVTKVTVEVLNPSERVFARDETILLLDVDGKWFPMPYASGDDTDTRPQGVEGKWEFIQFATDVRHFFIGWPGTDNLYTQPVKYSFKQAENHFHAQYYKDDLFNGDTYNIQQPFQAIHGYDQMTSFDFMDSKVAGLRGNMRSFANTVWGEDPLGMDHVSYNEDDNHPRGWASTFFGCVFPDGYKSVTEATEDGDGSTVISKGGNPSDYVVKRDWQVKACQPTVSAGIQFFFPTVNGSGSLDADTGTAIDKDTVAFTEDIERYSSELPDGSTRNWKYSTRSAPLLGLNNPKEYPLTKGTESWFGPVPMFAAALENEDYSVPHLPADIALNGAPGCKNGGPLTNMSLYKYIHEYEGWIDVRKNNFSNIYNTSEQFTVSAHAAPTRHGYGNIQDFFREFFFNNRYNWLYKSQVIETPAGGGGGTGDDDGGDGGGDAPEKTDRFNLLDSAFDFEPVNNGRIQFRPLKLEAYANQIYSVWGAGDSRKWNIVQEEYGGGDENKLWWEFFDYDRNFELEPDHDQKNKQHREYLWHWMNWYVMRDKANLRGIPAIARESRYNHLDGGGRDYNLGSPGSFRPKSDIDTVMIQAVNLLYVDGVYNYYQPLPSPLDENPLGFGLSFNVDINQGMFKQFNNATNRIGGSNGPFRRRLGFTSMPGGTNKPNNDPRNHWHEVDSMRPAGAVGVIGAVCTVGARDSIAFITDQTIGAQAIFNAAGGLGGPTWEPMWGGGNLKYDDFQTTDLSVRIFHAWPREQTIYDPRFFAVHHFNAGNTLPLDPAENITHGKPLNFNDASHYNFGQRYGYTRDFIGSQSVQSEVVDSDGDGNDDLVVPVVSTDVDMRTPSYVTVASDEAANLRDNGEVDDKGTIRSPIPVFGGDLFRGQHYIYRNAVSNSTGDPATGQLRLLKRQHWAVDYQRRGKLLPYKYFRNTVRLPFTDVDQTLRTGKLFENAGQLRIFRNKDLFDPEGNDSTGINEKLGLLPPSNADPGGVPVEEVAMVIVNLGEGYKPATSLEAEDGDKFELSSGQDVELMVMQTGVKGCVTELAVLHRGTDIEPEKFLPSGALVHQSSSTQCRVIRKTGAGKYFGAYFTQGVVANKSTTDAKPAIATEADYYQLSVKSDNTDGGAAGGLYNSSFIPVTKGNREQDIALTNHSDDARYDCFFHFHNDVSHTWFGDAGNARHASTMISHDQYITLDIDPK